MYVLGHIEIDVRQKLNHRSQICNRKSFIVVGRVLGLSYIHRDTERERERESSMETNIKEKQ